MKQNKTLRQIRRGELWMDALFAAPQFILFFSFTILPFLVAIPIVFTSQIDFADNNIRFVGLENFVQIFQRPIVTDFLPAVYRTGVFTLANYAMVWLVGLPLALLMYEFRARIKQVFFVIIYMPWMISGFGLGLLLIMLFARDTGSLNLLFLELGVLQEPVNVVGPFSIVALPLVVGWRAAGFNMAIFLTGLLTIDRDIIDAATIDGANYLQRLRRIYIPHIVPNITIASIACLVGSFGIFDPLVGLGAFTGNRNMYFVSILLYKYGFDVAERTGNLAQAVTISVVVYVPLMTIAVLLNRLQKRYII